MPPLNITAERDEYGARPGVTRVVYEYHLTGRPRGYGGSLIRCSAGVSWETRRRLTALKKAPDARWRVSVLRALRSLGPGYLLATTRACPGGAMFGHYSRLHAPSFVRGAARLRRAAPRGRTIIRGDRTACSGQHALDRHRVGRGVRPTETQSLLNRRTARRVFFRRPESRADGRDSYGAEDLAVQPPSPTEASSVGS